MVKTPKMRHSKASREPVTIDLDPEAVSRIEVDDRKAEAVGADETDPVTRPDDVTASPRVEETVSARVEEDEQTASMREPSGYSVEGDATSSPAGAQSAAYEAPADKARGGDTLSRIAAGATGAVVALLLAGALQYAGVLGAPGGSDSGVRADVEGLRQEFAALQSAAGSGDGAARLDRLATDVAALKTDVAALKAAPPAAGGSPDEAAALQALDGRVKAVEEALGKASQGGAPSDTAGLTDVAAKVASLEAAVKAASDAASAGDGRLTALEQSVAALSTKLDTQASQPKVALAIAMAGLRSAIERGAPFAVELDTIAALAPEATQVAALRAYADAGVASRDALVAQTPSAADAMVAAATPVDPNAGFFDRLLHSAESMVTVRPIGAVEGTDPAAIIARMEVAIKAGDLGAAVAEFDSLPEAVKAAGAAFGEKLKARQAVEALLDQAIAAAMKA